jgi:lipopolysaccharide export system permease protein
MSTCEMLAVIHDARAEGRNAAHDREELILGDLQGLLALPPLGTARPDTTPEPLPAYCRWIDRLQGVVPSKTVEPQISAQPPAEQAALEMETTARQGGRVQQPEPARAQPARGPAAQIPAPQVPAPQVPAPQGPAPQTPAMKSPPAKRPGVRAPLPGQWRGSQGPAAKPTPLPGRPPVGAPAQARGMPPGPGKAPPPLVFPKPAPGRLQLSNWAQVATAADRAKDAHEQADRYGVEVHKKWAISMACISFVIIGIVMALRFPRGGIGLVIGGGLLVFSIHYVGLTAGESLADRGLVSPWASMWTPNIVLTILGLIGLWRVSRESGSTRGGDFQELIDGLRHLARRLGRRKAAPAREDA